MEKTLGYIFCQLHDHDTAIKFLNRMLHRQIRFSRNASLSLLAISVYILMSEMRWSEQKELNKELRRELDALKQAKGE